MSERRAVVLLSGGLDSAVTLAYITKQQGYTCYALTIDYGQRHKVEISRAKKLAETYKVLEHKILTIDLRVFGGSALTSDIAVPLARSDDLDKSDNIPITYVPGRNTIFLSLAVSWAEVLQAEVIFIGANVVDYSGYPDCRPEYFEVFNQLIKLGTKVGTTSQNKLEISAPLLKKSKADIIKLGQELGLDLSLTTSCYNPDILGRACRECEACILRQKGFEEAGVIEETY